MDNSKEIILVYYCSKKNQEKAELKLKEDEDKKIRRVYVYLRLHMITLMGQLIGYWNHFNKK